MVVLPHEQAREPEFKEMPMRTHRFVLAICAIFLATNHAAAQNIVFILSDDQGWTGTSVQMDDRVEGSVSGLYRTPNLERLAAEGMRFSNAYSLAPNCSPTRMSIQTGKTAVRLGARTLSTSCPMRMAERGYRRSTTTCM